MDEYHKKGTTRRDLMKLGAASAVACIADSLPNDRFTPQSRH